jgi:DNA-binding CsgD family transcriptional regulator
VSLHDHLLRVQEAQGSESLLAASVKFAHWLGFDTISTIAGIDRPGGATAFACVDNAPIGFRQIMDSPGHGGRDPVMQHCKRSSLPLAWDQQTYVCAKRGDMWEQQAPYGYRTGICVALHLSGGRHVCMGVDRHDPLPKNPDERARLAAHLQLFLVYAQSSALDQLLPTVFTVSARLTNRECEALKWTMEGKTAWEVGCILGISEQTAVKHLHRASQKLGCSNKHHAAVMALRFGLIHL